MLCRPGTPGRNVTRSSVTVRRHAILGANVIVLPGITIGEGASVGAGSLVNRDLEPWTVNAGSPARAVKARPRQEILGLEQQLIEKYGPVRPLGA